MKTVYGWVVDWHTVSPNVTERWSIDLFFSSKEKFYELLGTRDAKQEILSPIEVPDSFNNLDYIPDNY